MKYSPCNLHFNSGKKMLIFSLLQAKLEVARRLKNTKSSNFKQWLQSCLALEKLI